MNYSVQTIYFPGKIMKCTTRKIAEHHDVERLNLSSDADNLRETIHLTNSSTGNAASRGTVTETLPADPGWEICPVVKMSGSS